MAIRKYVCMYNNCILYDTYLLCIDDIHSVCGGGFFFVLDLKLLFSFLLVKDVEAKLLSLIDGISIVYINSWEYEFGNNFLPSKLAEFLGAKPQPHVM